MPTTLSNMISDLNCTIGSETPNVIDEPRPVDYYDLSSCNLIIQETTIERKTDRSGRWLWRLVGQNADTDYDERREARFAIDN